jgi:hypothetical protein
LYTFIVGTAWKASQAARLEPEPSGWMSDMARQKKYDRDKDVRAIARERIGTVPAAKAMVPKPLRKKPKHKKPPGEETQ